MDSFLIWFIVIMVLFMLMLILAFIVACRYNVKSTFMLDELIERGGTVSYQGSCFKVYPGASAEVHIGYVIIRNPMGTARRFTIGNAFVPKPVITIGFDDE